MMGIGMAQNMKEIINFQIQNITASLGNIKLQMNNCLFITPDILITDGLDLINRGIQLLNIFFQSLNFSMDMKYNLKLEVNKIGFELQNISMILQNYEFIQNPNLNFGMNNMMMQNMVPNIPKEEKKTIRFETLYGRNINITLKESSTVGQVIENFFERCPEYNQIKSNIYFIYSAATIGEADKEVKIKDFFHGIGCPLIKVYEAKNFIPHLKIN